MQIFKYLFLALVLVTAIVSISPVAFAVHECVASTNADGTAHPARETDCEPCSSSGTGVPCSPTSAQGLLDIMNSVFTTMFVILVTVASFTLLYAAFLYVTSEGEQEKIVTAKKIIIYAVIALIVAALAWGAPRAIQGFIL